MSFMLKKVLIAGDETTCTSYVPDRNISNIDYELVFFI